MIKTIANKMEQALKCNGITAEITFCRGNMFSVFCENAADFLKAKNILSMSAKFDSEDCDPEVGFFGYFAF